MEVTAGFKQTEAGIIPDDWNIEYLDRCVRSDAPICYGILMPGKHFDGGVPVVKVRDIIGGRIDESNLLLTHTSIDDSYRRSRLSHQDVLITIRGTTGRVAVVPKSLSGANITQDTARARITNKHSGHFLYFVLQSEALQKQISLKTIGQAVKGINIRDVKRLALPLPPTKSEQEAIAGALSDADGLIESLEQLIAKKQAIKRGAMQELLTGRRRLPGFSGEWKTKRLSDLCTMKSGESITARHIYNLAQYPCYGGNGLRGFTTRFTHDGQYGLVGRVGALCGNVRKVTGKFFASEHAIVVASLANIDVSWLTLALERLDLNRRAESSAQPVLTVSKLLPIEVFSPPTQEEQQAIATVLSDIDTEVAAIEKKLAKLRHVKQGMMQELLTGRIRLI